jgi:hypothetical protein
MDTIEGYRQIVHQVILEYAGYKPSNGRIETEVIVDAGQNHFEVLHVGWDGPRRVHGMVIHVDIIGDKVWIQHDGTSPGIAEDLVEAGIPRTAIVLGFRPPHVRQYSGFAIA